MILMEISRLVLVILSTASPQLPVKPSPKKERKAPGWIMCLIGRCPCTLRYCCQISETFFIKYDEHVEFTPDFLDFSIKSS